MSESSSEPIRRVTSEISPPRIRQGSSAPVFRGCGEKELSCECGQLLIGGYEARCYAGFGIECFSCSHITELEHWPAEEPLPQQLVNLGSSGVFLIGRTVEANKAALITSQQEIDRVAAFNAANGKPRTLTIDRAGLEELQKRFELAGGNAFRSALGQTRALRSRGGDDKKFPLAWSLVQLATAVDRQVINADMDDGVALSFLRLAEEGLWQWELHPLSDRIASGLFTDDFHHSVTALITASYLRQVGNLIGITDSELEQRARRQSPDLFLNISAIERFSIEVKAPKAFRWPNKPPSEADATKLIERLAKEAKKQLTGQEGGLLVVGASFRNANWLPTLVCVINDLLTRKRISSKIAAVAYAFVVLDGATADRGLWSRNGPEVRFDFVPNPSFAGEVTLSRSHGPQSSSAQ